MELQEREFMTVEELAKKLGVGIAAVYTYMRSDGFPAMPHGKRGYVVPKAAFNAWISDPKNIIEYKRLMRG